MRIFLAFVFFILIALISIIYYYSTELTLKRKLKIENLDYFRIKMYNTTTKSHSKVFSNGKEWMTLMNVNGLANQDVTVLVTSTGLLGGTFIRERYSK
jgi:hypothetical protein